MGKLIVIEGLDGSGKATQSRLLCQRLEQQGKSCKKVTFPDYDHESSAFVKLYLSGALGSAEEVGAYAASTFFAVDRYVSFKLRWGSDYAADTILVADRYSTSNATHQTTKLPREQWDEYLDWMEDYEYGKLGLPRPDMVIFLSVPPAISQKLIEGRYQGDNAKKDIHEADLGYLERCYAGAGYVAQRQGWRLLDCAPNGEILSVEEISDKIWEMIGAII
ncbi:MAG: deoxynucleoside kinase [Oscillospiraceae bacterium]|nr:deoxynucleoside kinase [Oscillospiraceae bacterium]